MNILYEDDAIVIVNKPAPLPMHPCGRFNRNTLASILNQLYKPQKLRLAHRLDANTTGVVVFSRSKHVARTIQSAAIRRVHIRSIYRERHGKKIKRAIAAGEQEIVYTTTRGLAIKGFPAGV